MGPTGKTRIVQIHPTRKCNLCCKHCYSSSSPQARDTLDATLLKEAIDDLAREGYEWISFSGGEPLVYDPLPELIQHVRQAGLHATLVSNGMLLRGERVDALEGQLDALVISLDGKPESHNIMRNSARAFQAMEKNLPALVNRGIPFGFLFTLTQNNLAELPWVVEFCANVGAVALLIHPLEQMGHASEQLAAESPDALNSNHAWLLVEKLKAHYQGRLNIQLDLVHTSVFDQQPDQFFLGDYETPLRGPLSELLSVLIIEPDGEVVPLQYGFSRRYSLGNLAQHSVDQMVERWRTTVGPQLHQLSRSLNNSVVHELNGQFINWYERLNQYANREQVITRRGRAIPDRKTGVQVA